MRKPAPSVSQIQAALPGRIYYGDNLVLIIRSNGTRIGQGELVAVGDVLGVQLLSLDVEGLR